MRIEVGDDFRFPVDYKDFPTPFLPRKEENPEMPEGRGLPYRDILWMVTAGPRDISVPCSLHWGD